MSTSFKSIRIFFDVEQNRILFHNGDQEHFRAVYEPVYHHIVVSYLDDHSVVIEQFKVTAPQVVRDNIEAWLYKNHLAIDIEGTTGKLYDERKKEIFELMRKHK